MISLWTLAITLGLVLGSPGVLGRAQQLRRGTPNDAIFFPGSNSRRFQSSKLTGLKREVADSESDLTHFSDLYPQTNFFNVERPESADSPDRGPQNSFGFPGGWNSQRGSGNFNGRPNNFNNGGNNFARVPQGGNRPNWGQGGNQNQPWGQGGNQNQPWGQGGNQNQPWGGNQNQPWGNGNRPGDDNDDDGPFVFDRPPPTRPGGGGRPPTIRPPPNRPGGGGRPPTIRPPPGRPSTRPTARPTPSASTTTPGRGTTTTTTPQPVTSPTPAPTRPGCTCPSTPEFNPVCGQDSVTYSNPGKMRCANICGNNVVLKHYGACIRTTTPQSGKR